MLASYSSPCRCCSHASGATRRRSRIAPSPTAAGFASGHADWKRRSPVGCGNSRGRANRHDGIGSGLAPAPAVDGGERRHRRGDLDAQSARMGSLGVARRRTGALGIRIVTFYGVGRRRRRSRSSRPHHRPSRSGRRAPRHRSRDCRSPGPRDGRPGHPRRRRDRSGIAGSRSRSKVPRNPDPPDDRRARHRRRA